MKKCRIFVVDDHSVVREGFISLIREKEEYHVSGEASNGRETLELIESMEFKPHVVLMDINMPEMDGLACTKFLAEQYPKIKVIALTMVQQHAHVRKMLDAGAVGYILKSGSKLELYEAIEEVMQGNTYFSSSVSKEVMAHMTRLRESETPTRVSLSAREREVLALILKDCSNQQIARELGISVRTVETHKHNLIDKTGTNSVAGLVVHALKNNLVETDWEHPDNS